MLILVPPGVGVISPGGEMRVMAQLPRGRMGPMGMEIRHIRGITDADARGRRGTSSAEFWEDD